MNTVKIIGPVKKLDDVVKCISDCGFFEPEYAKNFFGDTSGFIEFSKENPYTAPLQKVIDAVTLSGKELKRKDISDFTISDEQINLFLEKLNSDVANILESKSMLEQENAELKSKIEQLSHFKELDIPLESMFKSEFVKARFGRIPKESYEKLKEYDDNPYVLFFPCQTDEYCWGAYLAPTERIREVDRIFSSIYFERIQLPWSDVTPIQAIERFEVDLTKNNESLRIYDDKLEEYWNREYDFCLKVYTYLSEMNNLFELKKYSIVENREQSEANAFLYCGFVPKRDAKKLKALLSKISGIDVELEDSDYKSPVKVPTLLKNGIFSKPYEFYVEMFGTPNYSEIDPTLFVGITYTLLFGIMFADVGHGLVLALIAFFLWKLKKNRLGPILLRCGISSAFFGLVFGSVFGYEHLMDPIYKALFNLETKPISVLDKANITKVLFIPLGIGAALILLAMILNIVVGFKQKNIEKALFSNNGLAGFIFYGGIAFAAAELVLFNNNIISTPYIICVLVLPIILMMFKEILAKLITRQKNPFPKKWGDYIIQNFFEVFDYLISYVSNTISFMRVGAFVLIHAIMMEVVFIMAEMFGSVGHIVVIVIGNIFVLGLEALLVSIQGLRLEFYEMFSRFFSGDGRPFKPIKSLKTDK
jgi:V/A-type H+-transporting ATPase subunit I